MSSLLKDLFACMPFCMYATFRAVIAYAAHDRLFIKSFDVENAFLNYPMNEGTPGTLASRNGNDNTDSQVVGVANVHVDAVLL